MANHMYYELPADPIESTPRPLTSSQTQQQQQQQPPPPPPLLPPRNPLASSPDDNEESTIRGVPGDDPSAIPLPLFTRRSNSNLLSQTSANSTHNTTPTPSNRPPAPTVESYETNSSDNPSPLPRHRSDSNTHTGPALPPRRISQHNPNEVYYTRDSHRVIAYLIPLPKPIDVSDADFPQVQNSYHFTLGFH